MRLLGGGLWRRYGKSDRGNAALVTALAIIPFSLAAGAALDFGRLQSGISSSQASLDSVALSVAASVTKISDTDAQQMFMHNLVDSDVQVSAVTINKDSSGHVTATANGTVKTSLMSLAGLTTMDFSISSEANGPTSKKLATVTFQVISAKGAYDKDIYFFTRDAKGNILTRDLMLSYDATYDGSNWSETYTPNLTSSKTINVADYASWGIEMDVFADTSLWGLHINKIVHYSDDFDANLWTKTTGECSDPGGQTNYWEDGGDTDFMDFVFSLKCTYTGGTGSTTVRLTK